MSDGTSRKDARAIEDVAAAWVVKLTSAEMTEAQRGELQAWLQADPEHRRHFRAMQSVWDYAPEPAVAASRDHRRARPAYAVPLAAAAVLALTTLSALLYVYRPQYELYRTAIGERSTVTGADGSIVNLNTGSQFELRVTQRQRSARLRSGEAFFSVRSDPQRPFKIDVQDAVIEVVGTRFNVRREPEYFSVAVTQGVVRVRLDASMLARERPPLTLKAGEQLIYRHDGGAPVLGRASDKPAPDWVSGKLRFERTALPAALAEANRYLQQPIVIADPRLDDVRISGVFFVDRLDEMVTLLEEEGVVRAERVAGERRLRLYAP